MGALAVVLKFRPHSLTVLCRLPSGESVLAGRPDPSELKSGAKLPPSIQEIDRLLKMGDAVAMYTLPKLRTPPLH